jgi:2-hydroxychromene-2-carboxylate isomerase
MTMDAKRKALWLFVVGGLMIAFALAFFVSPYASTSPDGLNKVAADKGFDGSAQQHAFDDGPVAGYAVKGVDDAKLSKGLSGIIGVTMTFGIGLILFGLLVRRNHRAPSPTDASGGNASTAAGVT